MFLVTEASPLTRNYRLPTHTRREEHGASTANGVPSSQHRKQMLSARAMLLPSPLCSQVILGMGANAATVPNNTARAASSPPMGAYILIDTASAGASAANAVGRGHSGCSSGRCSEPQGHDAQHGHVLVDVVTPEDPHFSTR